MTEFPIMRFLRNLPLLNVERGSIAALLTFIAPTLFGAVSCPPIFTDNMVLQRETPIAIWGAANPGESISVAFDTQHVETVADANGKWSLSLAPLAASFDPRTLTISGENSLVFENVLIGEVWLCSGQSNMEKPLGEQRGQQPTDHYEEALAQAELPNLRLFTVPRWGKATDDAHHYKWRSCSAETVENMRFSAVGFHFGKKLSENLDVPIGLIHSAFGGSMVEAWLPQSAFERSPTLAPLLDQPYFAWVEDAQATDFYESMIRPILPYTLRGYIWYQGESNLMHGDTTFYRRKLHTLIDAWREAWGNPSAPFYFAQIAPCTYSELIYGKSLSPNGLPMFWEVQLAAIDPERNIEAIPTVDLVTNVRDIHPTNKRDVGIRFANLALNKTYGKRGFPCEIPQFDAIKRISGNAITIALRNLPSDLTQERIDQDRLFEIAGPDGRYHNADAKLSGDLITLSSNEVQDPKNVRYAWDERASPTKSENGTLPIYPFRTDSINYATLIPQFHKPIRIDLSPNLDRSETTDTDWIEWQVADGAAAKRSFGDLTVELSSDRASPQVEKQAISLAGLSAGPHTITIYHRAAKESLAIFRNGAPIGEVPPTHRAGNAHSSGNFHYAFESKKNETVRFEVQLENGKEQKGSILTGITIDTPDPKHQAHAPYPKNRDTNVKVRNGRVTLDWKPTTNASNYKIYLFKNEETDKAIKKVNRAGRSSSTLIASTSDTEYDLLIDNPQSMDTYAWRIDAIDENGLATRGPIWSFALHESASPQSEEPNR